MLTHRLLLLTLALVILIVDTNASIKLPFQRKKYTPLLFFKDEAKKRPQSLAMEKIVKQVEKELGVRVERLDAARDKYANNLMHMLHDAGGPILYHRESKQMIPSVTDIHRTRAWAKGRRVKSVKKTMDGGGADGDIRLPDEMDIVVDGQDDDEDEDEGRTPRQKAGKQAIRDRTRKNKVSSRPM